MEPYIHKSIDGSSLPALFGAFSAACERHRILPDGEQGRDLTTVLWRAFGKGVTTEKDLATLITNLSGK